MELLQVITSLLLLAASTFANEALSKTCCDQGRQNGTSGSCVKKDMMNAAKANNMLCNAAWMTCCLMSKQVRSCHAGMMLAMRMGSCKFDSDGKCTYMKELCCNECNVGFSFAAAGKDCESIGIISSAGVSRTCCREMKNNERLKSNFAKAELGISKRSDGSSPDEGSTKKDGTPTMKPTQAAPKVGPTKAKPPTTVKAGAAKMVTTAAPPVARTQKPRQTCLSKKCSHSCRDTSLGPVCSCRGGYSLAADGVLCQDINECLNPNMCGPEGQCVNQPGNYYCRCSPGSDFDSITRRCKSFNPCDRVTCAYQCKNLGKGRYRCLCPEGQVLNKDRRTCRDYSPCENNPCKHQCKVLGLYRYRCVCPPGYQIAKDSVSCEVNKYEVLMTVKNIDKVMTYSLQWMENNQRMRIDIPTDTTVTRTFKYQMATEPNSLAMQLYDVQNRLIPLNGKDYYIVRPALGMTTIELNVGQANRNPCSTNPCHHICTATGATTYRCSCRPGFAFGKDGRCTVSRDPCSTKPCQHQCFNMGGGSYICSCPYGQQLNADSRTCRVVDACLNSRCQWKCKAEEKSAVCLCPNGYVLNGSKCVDIDECKVGRSTCGEGTSCFNTLGSYICIPSKCPGKYYKKYRERYCYKQCSFGDDKCYKEKVYVHQWLMSAVRNNLPPNYVSYYYSVYKPSFPHNVRFEIRSGNEDAAFYLVRDTEYKVTIKNRKKLVGPKDYKLELVVSIYKNGQLNSQIITNFYVYVSTYQF